MPWITFKKTIEKLDKNELINLLMSIYRKGKQPYQELEKVIK
tara:strand:+ start:696 stop:821 length:126 start_codon:yes stop_codon:yes gene_type:complete